MTKRKERKLVSFDWAMKNGADYVATGHYSRIQRSQDTNHKIQDTNLLKGKDANKDQSYFLWTLKQGQLNRTLFPIGEYEKPKVRELAEKFGLPTAAKKDSQGLCFVGKVDMKEFLQHFIDEKPGNVLDTGGNVIGVHDGATFYTIGQRHGFTITKKGTEDTPHYIVKKNIDKNTITVSVNKVEDSFAEKRVELTEINWIDDVPKSNKKYTAKLWYRADTIDCEIDISDKVFVVFEKLHNFTSGQSLVLYDGEVCVGGGVVA